MQAGSSIALPHQELCVLFILAFLVSTTWTCSRAYYLLPFLPAIWTLVLVEWYSNRLLDNFFLSLCFVRATTTTSSTTKSNQYRLIGHSISSKTRDELFTVWLWVLSDLIPRVIYIIYLHVFCSSVHGLCRPVLPSHMVVLYSFSSRFSFLIFLFNWKWSLLFNTSPTHFFTHILLLAPAPIPPLLQMYSHFISSLEKRAPRNHSQTG